MTELSMLNLISQHEIILEDLESINYLSKCTTVNIDNLTSQLTEQSNSMRQEIDNFCARIKVNES